MINRIEAERLSIYPRPAIFLDRDGVINEEVGYISRIEDFYIYPFAKECIDIIHDKGYYAIVVSNQSGIARGLLTLNLILKINSMMKNRIGIDAAYFCPHFINGSIPEYSVGCDCRKPKTGLIKRAYRDFNIKLKDSYMIGDRATDVELGKNAGIKTIMVETGYGKEEKEAGVKPDFVCKDLRDAVKLL